MNKITINNSTQEQICNHLISCSKSFTPELSSYVDIERYSKKLYENSRRIELIVDNILVGLIAFYNNQDKKNLYITNVSVMPEYQNQGVAQALLDVCKSRCVDLQYSNITLEVFKDNKSAINFYEKNDFILHEAKNNTLILKWNNMNRNYNQELQDTPDHKYAYNFDFDVMHHYMIESFKHHFVEGNCLELGSFKGDFTKRLINYFEDITCVEASDEAVVVAKQKLGDSITYVNSLFETVQLPKKYDNIILTHVLEHIDDPVGLLSRIKNEWLSDNGKLFLVCPNANAPSRQIAVKMGLITHNSAITPAEAEHGHRITYTLDTLERDAKDGGLNVIYRSGIFFKALANFQWDQLLNTDIISKEYLDGCYQLGQQYPDLCSSIILICKK